MRRAVAIAAVALVVAGCGSSGGTGSESTSASTAASSNASSTTASPPTSTAPSTTVVDEPAIDTSRIIPVNGDLAEVVWALGFGDNVVATDISATYPPAADASPKIGYQRALTAETVLSYEPTLVLADDLAGPAEVLDQLRAADVRVVVIDRKRTIDGPVEKVRAVAAALGVVDRGEDLIATMQHEIDGSLALASAAVAESGRPRVLALYLRGTSVQLTFGKGSGVDVIIDAAGGLDVGTEAGIVDTQELSIEAIVEAAPEILLVTTTGLESVGGIDGLLLIPGLDRTPAAKDRRVVAFEDQYLYGFGPRVGQLLGDLVTAFHQQGEKS